MRSTASPAAIWAGLLTIYVVWGTTYLGIAFAIETIPPYVMVAVRFTIAGLLLAAIAAIRNGGLRRPSRREVLDSLIVGAGLVAVGNALVGWGEQTVATGIAALLIALMPAWAAFLGRVFFGDRLPALAFVGIAIGLAGIAILSWPVGGSSTLEPAGLLALLIAPIGWSSASLYSAKRAHHPSPALFSTALQMFLGGLVGFAVAGVTGELGAFHPAAVSGTSILAMVYLTIVGSLIGYTTYGWLLRVAPISRVATYAYINPIVAVGLGVVVLNEPFTPRTVVASVVIVVAVALIVRSRGRATQPARQPAANSAQPDAEARAA
ncbi:MAG: EamA family transporter [Chloroflexota bacterium]